MSNRSITFTIPAKLGLGVQVTVVENENGNLDFTVDVPGLGTMPPTSGVFSSTLSTNRILAG